MVVVALGRELALALAPEPLGVSTAIAAIYPPFERFALSVCLLSSLLSALRLFKVAPWIAGGSRIGHALSKVGGGGGVEIRMVLSRSVSSGASKLEIQARGSGYMEWLFEDVLTKRSTDGWIVCCDFRSTILPLFRSLELSTGEPHRLPSSALDFNVNNQC